MRWSPSKPKERDILSWVGICIIAVMVVGVIFFAGTWIQKSAGEPYAGGALIDATGPVIYEEDDDVEDLGVRLVALAAGETFTEEQIEQLKDLVAGLFWAISLNSWNIEELKFRVELLENETRGEAQRRSDREERSARGQEYK